MGKRLSSPDFLVQAGPLRSMGRVKERLDKWKVDKTELAIPQVEPLRDEKYRQWVAGLWCAVCGVRGCECAHVRYGLAGGTALRPSDDRTVPLCFHHHNDGTPECQHRFPGGERAFWQFHGRDPLLMAAWLRESYLADPNDLGRALHVIRSCGPREGI